MSGADRITVGSVPVVFVHGFASSTEHNFRRPGWFDVLTEAGRQCHGFDLPGHGERAADVWPEGYVEIEQRFIDGLEAPVVDAIGFSAGAVLLLTAATLAPERFRRIALIGIGDYVLGESDQPLKNLYERLAEPLDPHDVETQLFVRMAASAGNELTSLRRFLSRPTVARVNLESLAKVECPVLVILGSEDFVGPADRLATALPCATQLSLAGADHFSSSSDYRTIAAVVQFLNKS